MGRLRWEHKMDSLIIVPVYNVEKNIGKLLDMMETYKDDLIIINDGSIDHTEEIIKKMEFNYLNNGINKGVSYSINRGIEWGKKHGYHQVILMDGDGQHEPKYIPYFNSQLSKGYDYVYGTRFSKDVSCPESKLCANILVSLLVREKWNVYIKDIACGFKSFKLYKGIEDNINKKGGYSLVYDTLFYCLEKGYNITSVNINPIYFPGELWFTRNSEINALIMALDKFPDNNIKLKNYMDLVKESIIKEKDFQLEFDGKIFYAFYIENRKGYIIQSDIKKLYDYLA